MKGDDIYLTLPLAPWEAALGAKIKTPTLAGKVDLTVPPGSQAGQKLRLKGKGMPGKKTGDQYIILKVVTPKAKTEADKSIYLKMKEAMPFNPRASMEGL